MTPSNSFSCAAVLAALAASSPVVAGFTLSASSQGMSSLFVPPGAAFSVDIVLDSDAADVINSAIFRLEFSRAGLGYSAYSWSTPFVAGSIFDQSVPGFGSLPTTLDESTLAGDGYPIDVVDIELANAAPGLFTGGVLVTLDLFVPTDFPLGKVVLSLVPDTFANGFQVVPTVAGEGFTLTVVPTSPTLVAILGVLHSRGRRRLGHRIACGRRCGNASLGR